MSLLRAVLLAAVTASLAAGNAVAQSDNMTRGSSKTMKELVSQGFEVRSHQFYRCGNNPAEDQAMTCISLVLQKGPLIANCMIDRAHFLVGAGFMNIPCVLFE